MQVGRLAFDALINQVVCATEPHTVVSKQVSSLCVCAADMAGNIVAQICSSVATESPSLDHEL